jgi:copper(I)-binding protein
VDAEENRMKLLPLATIILLAISGSSAGHEFKLTDVEITHPYLVATLPGAKTASAYMILTNTGSEPDRLLAIETDAAVKVEFHQTVVTDGVATMRPILGGLEIPAGGEYRLGADGSHAMLVGLSEPISLGQLIEATLNFEKAGPIEITFEVEPVGTTLEGAEEAHGH